MPFQPTDTLRNRTFWGLIIAQFLAGFNDQFIHAAAMFYAIRRGILTEAQAITLMPILFYAPWAIFCTLSGWLADRYSKTYSLVVWKVAEVIIAVVSIVGFYLGTVHGSTLGACMVLSTVFLMGTHAAFFAPAKYGSMPQILQPHVLSRGNGILESTTFLAAILGTVSGGLLSFVFRDQEYWIGGTLLVLALIGAGASLLIAYLPPGNPARPFPVNLFKPLLDNLKILFRSRPLALAVLGIAFFIFMVTYMRAVMYMHGQTRNPRWNEFTTSLIVATVALGVGLGSPLAGFLSGGKVELGLVPLGTLGMIVACLFAGGFINLTWALIIGLVIIGFFSGFYMVPLYTLLQHRAPKTSKGDLIATSNFINVTGAMAASLLFYLLILFCQVSSITPEVPQEDRVAVGRLAEIHKEDKHKQIIEVTVNTNEGRTVTFQATSVAKKEDEADTLWDLIEAGMASPEEMAQVVEFDDNLFEALSGGLQPGDKVVVSRYALADPKGRPVTHYFVRRADQPLKPVYDNRGLPRFLFFGAALMAFGIQTLLRARLPDIFVRTLFWFRELGKYRIKVEGSHSLPTQGPVILATNCDDLEKNLQLVAVTDRYTRCVVAEGAANGQIGGLLGYATRRVSTLPLPLAGDPEPALAEAIAALAQEHLVAITIDGQAPTAEMEKFLDALRARTAAPIVPVYCGPLAKAQARQEHLGLGKWVHVAFGKPLGADAGIDEIRRHIHQLAEGTHPDQQEAVTAH
jgi:MFS family permease